MEFFETVTTQRAMLVIRDAAKRARLGELYRELWAELMKTPYYRGAAAAPSS